jgi:hypothetical protein
MGLHLHDRLSREELPAATKAALALVDEQIEDLVAAMQTDEASAAAAHAFETAPRVKIGASAALIT